MNIGFVIGRIGGIDGVALETEKWIAVLERMGHTARVISGALEGEVDNVHLLPQLSFDHPDALDGQQIAFLGQAAEEEPFFARLDREADVIYRGIVDWIERERIDCLVSENASALPCHLTMGMAIERVFRDTGIAGVTHDHDFHWERPGRYDTTFDGVRRLVERCFPVRLPNVRHAVINSAARRTLAERFGIDDAVVVPNVMDFDRPFCARDDYNADLVGQLGCAPDDKLLFQITRIVARKGIDIAIDLVHRLADPKVKLVITGTAVDDTEGVLPKLMAQVERLGLGDQVLFCGHRFDNQRRTDERGRKVYSLADGYARATACTYFSLYEGFGNAFVEAVVARVPIFVNNYKPVYWPDIGSFGFDTVMIDDGELTDEAVEQVRRVLADGDLRQQWTDHNVALGREHLSYDTLEQLLAGLFGRP